MAFFYTAAHSVRTIRRDPAPGGGMFRDRQQTLDTVTGTKGAHTRWREPSSGRTSILQRSPIQRRSGHSWLPLTVSGAPCRPSSAAAVRERCAHCPPHTRLRQQPPLQQGLHVPTPVGHHHDVDLFAQDPVREKMEASHFLVTVSQPSQPAAVGCPAATDESHPYRNPCRVPSPHGRLPACRTIRAALHAKFRN